MHAHTPAGALIRTSELARSDTHTDAYRIHEPAPDTGHQSGNMGSVIGVNEYQSVHVCVCVCLLSQWTGEVGGCVDRRKIGGKSEGEEERVKMRR